MVTRIQALNFTRHGQVMGGSVA